MSMKITVIGGSGFVGTYLCRELKKRNIEFEIIDLKMSKQFPERCKIGDIRNIHSLRATMTGNTVVNLAAVHRDDIFEEKEYLETNVGGAQNLVNICNEKKINKIIFTSTVAVYGFAEPGTGENGKILPFNAYGKSKFQAEELFREWQKMGERSLIIVRPTVIFGEGNRGNVFNLINQIASGKFLMIGSGLNKKSMAYIGNVSLFLLSCINSQKKYAMYNYVDTPNLTMNELVKKIRLILFGKNNVGLRIPYRFGLIAGYFADAITTYLRIQLPISSIRVKKFAASTEFESSKFQLDNFEPKFQLHEALERTLIHDFINPDPNGEIFYTE